MQLAFKGGGMPLPVNHVRAGDMGIGDAVLIFDDVVKVIPAFPEEDAIGIARSGFGRMGEMVGAPGCRRLGRHRRGVRLWGWGRRRFRRRIRRAGGRVRFRTGRLVIFSGDIDGDIFQANEQGRSHCGYDHRTHLHRRLYHLLQVH